MKFWIAILACVMVWPMSAVRADGPYDRLASEKEDDDEGYQPGHSLHGAVFNEGPRQAAYLMENMGTVNFPVTTDSPLAQKFINQGVTQLHGFWFIEAERSFREAAKHDPNCVMAYWGMAMANVMNLERYRKFTKEAEKRIDQASEREALYIRALRNLPQLAQVVKLYPDDIEAMAFLGIYPYYRAQNERAKMYGMEEADAYLDRVFAVNPLHPAHHYRIHLWDTVDTPRGLDSAAKVVHTAPGVPHMWHMAGHLFSLAERHREAAWYMEAAMRLDHKYTIKDRVHPDLMHVYCHNVEWLIRCLAQCGQVRAAIERCKDLTDLPRHPRYNNLEPESSSAYGRLRLFEVLTEYELWDELIALADTHYLEPTREFDDRLRRHRYLAIAHLRNGNPAGADEQLQAIAEMRAEQEDLAAGQASKRLDEVDETIAKIAAHRAVMEQRTRWSDLSTRLIVGLAVISLVLLLAARMFERTALRVAYLVVLLAAGGFGVYWLSGPTAQAATLAPMFHSRDLYAYGRTGEAVAAAQAYVDEHPNEVRPLADLVYLLWESGDEAEAKEQFETLRKLSGDLDLDMPAFARLQPAAEKLGYPTDWRIPVPMPEEHGELPELDSLGPIRWRPSPAPEWTLPNVDNETKSLADYKGKPLVLVFYLGHGCLHCAEQLHEFAERAADFEKAGLTVVAVSTDKQPLLKKALDNFTGEKLPFEILADPDLEVFKEYRCFDDFENLTMHGTFIIDEEGLIRWQDISYEPFMKVDFLLDEADRQLRRVKDSE